MALTPLDRCKICRVPNRRRLIEFDWDAGVGATTIAKSMTDTGFPITAPTITNHIKQHRPVAIAATLPPAVKRDAAVFVRDRIMDEVERREGLAREARERGENALADDLLKPMDILDARLQPAIGSMLKAQAIIDKRETDKKPKTGLFMLMLGVNDGTDGRLAPLRLTDGKVGEDEPDDDADDDDIFEGEAVEIDTAE